MHTIERGVLKGLLGAMELHAKLLREAKAIPGTYMLMYGHGLLAGFHPVTGEIVPVPFEGAITFETLGGAQEALKMYREQLRDWRGELPVAVTSETALHVNQLNTESDLRQLKKDID